MCVGPLAGGGAGCVGCVGCAACAGCVGRADESSLSLPLPLSLSLSLDELEELSSCDAACKKKNKNQYSVVFVKQTPQCKLLIFRNKKSTQYFRNPKKLSHL